ncbi:MAG: cytochrome c [Acidobacteria bacterium]|nr:cytochrome c [Acidobacteriota bacterium]MBI3421603.1 cytochrome c [Acidobacteriota bacterium]
MHDNPKYKAYRDGGMREYPAGVVARGSIAANPAAPPSAMGNAQQVQTVNAVVAGDPSAAPTPIVIPKGEDAFPFKVTQEILDRGQERFNINCAHCHGKLGRGDGMIALRGFKKPPSYHDDRLRQAPASYFYDVMTNGFGAMSDYAAQVTPEDRWKIAAYIRVLQLSQRADFNTLPEADKEKVRDAATQKPAATGHGATAEHGGEKKAEEHAK